MLVQNPELLRILVVDDDDCVRDLLRDILEFEGYAVTTADGGSEALALFDAGRFEAVFTDVGMPDMSGWELARRVRERDAAIPLAIITGWGSSIGPEEQAAAQVNWVVTKPFEMSHITEIAHQVSRCRTKAA